MQIILWRHATAIDLNTDSQSSINLPIADLSRSLTAHGKKQAADMAKWINHNIPQDTKILVSPALRTIQTADALGKNYTICNELKPDAGSQAMLKLIENCGAKNILIIGHQPTLGQIAAKMLKTKSSECSIKKGGLWWFKERIRNNEKQAVLLTVQNPEML